MMFTLTHRTPLQNIHMVYIFLWFGVVIKQAVSFVFFTLQWRHNEHDVVSNHQRLDWLLNRLFRHRSKKTSKFHVTGLCEGNSPMTYDFPAQWASNAENVSIWWRHHEYFITGGEIIIIQVLVGAIKFHCMPINHVILRKDLDFTIFGAIL